MNKRSHAVALFLAASILLSLATACNLPTTTRARIPVLETATVPAVNTEARPADTASQETAIPTGTGATPANGSNPGSGLSIPPVPIENTTSAEVSVVGGSASFEGQITFPGKNDSYEITVKPVGFTSQVTSGSLVFTLTCSGKGKAKVNYKGGAVRNGSPGCGETWTVSVVNGSPDSHITIHLDSGGDVKWTLSVLSGD